MNSEQLWNIFSNVLIDEPKWFVFRSHCRYLRPTGGAGFIRSVDMGFSGMFSDPHCTYINGLQVELF